jgi:uncharacterized membrane protein (UPF0127 family)
VSEQDFVKIADNEFPTLLAISTDEQERGLMHIDWPPPVMSFVYRKPAINKFWMANTKVALDIVFCLKNKITSIKNGEPMSTRIIGDNIPSDLVIELPSGTCSKNNIVVGDNVELKCSQNSLMKILATKIGI